MKAILIPGLGANAKAFAKIGDLGIPMIYVPWIKNLEEESIESYAQRLIEIHKINANDIIIGLSFGGLIAQHISHQLKIKETILISSFRTYKDLKLPLKLGLVLSLNKFIPSFRIPIVDFVVAYFLNSGTKDSIKILIEMLKETDYPLMKWSIEQIRLAKNPVDDTLILHNFIGNNDRIMSYWKNDTTILIEGGTHFMVYDQGERITEGIRKIIS